MIFHGLGLQLICLINIQENGFGDHLNPLQSYLSTSLGKGQDLFSSDLCVPEKDG